MAARNISLNLPASLIRRAKAYAALNNTTVNALVRKLLEEALPDEDRAYLAGKRILEITKRGPFSNVDPATIRREDLYDRW